MEKWEHVSGHVPANQLEPVPLSTTVVWPSPLVTVLLFIKCYRVEEGMLRGLRTANVSRHETLQSLRSVVQNLYKIVKNSQFYDINILQQYIVVKVIYIY